MSLDLQSLKPALEGEERAAELIHDCRKRLGGDWRLISASMKLRKVIFEAEFNGRRVIGKVSRSERAQSAHKWMHALWDAGMQPPAEHTIPEPVEWCEEHHLLLQEKAPGVSFLDIIQTQRTDRESVRRAADWLKRLSSMDVEAEPRPLDSSLVKERGEELGLAMQDVRPKRLALEANNVLSREAHKLVPSHGDYHPMNIFLAPDRVTVIDLDTFALRDCEADISYFLAQTANFGLMAHGSFDATRELRSAFLSEFPSVDLQRIAAYMAWTLLQSLHFDYCILKVKNDKANAMLTAAETLLRTGVPELHA